MFDINTDESNELIMRMYTSFKKVNICKPPCSKPINSEKYIVCLGYNTNGIKRTDDEIKNYMAEDGVPAEAIISAFGS